VREVLEAISGLGFIRDVVESATSIDDPDLAVDVDGALDAHAACPGWDATLPADDATNGFIDVTIGVEDTRVQRSFSGHATNCRFVTERSGQRANAVASMDLEVDLGGSLGLGESVPAILVRATNLSGTIGTVPLALGQQVVSFRLLADDSVETLIAMATLPISVAGTALIALRPDGSWSLRARDSEWVCSTSGGSAPCVPGVAP
jgi:hypothetical protein